MTAAIEIELGDVDQLLVEVGALHSLVVDLVDTRQAQAGAIGSSSGHAAPLNLDAVQVDTDTWATLAHHARHLGLRTRGYDVRSLVPRLRMLLAEAEVDQLVELRRELEALKDSATELVDGVDRLPLDADCPWCHRRTLVVDLVDSTISCQRSPSGRFEPCTCDRPACDCHAAPITFRHTWRRDQAGSSEGWLALASKLNLSRYRKARTS